MAETEAIPEEVMREAQKAFHAAIAGPNGDEVNAIARALLAAESRGREMQKQADARIAEREAGIIPKMTSWGEGYRTACAAIASAIRR